MCIKKNNLVLLTRLERVEKKLDKLLALLGNRSSSSSRTVPTARDRILQLGKKKEVRRASSTDANQ
ncbi:MAG: hypothetical protein CMP20_04485 [Rickettsiales bacterium]|nr:hypothetical protein [Rickettsiales bacterium]